jgi:hypothetical protein
MVRKTNTLPHNPALQAWRDLIKPMKRYGIALLDQQLWCWGYDIRQAENWLLRYGGIQYRQDKSCGGTVYTFESADQMLIRLWGGNVLCMIPSIGMLHLKRYEFEPRLMPLTYTLAYSLPTESTIPESSADIERAAMLAGACMRWIADYEGWILANAGLEHRQRSVKAWNQDAVFTIAPERMSELWADYAALFAEFVIAAQPPNMSA